MVGNHPALRLSSGPHLTFVLVDSDGYLNLFLNLWTLGLECVADDYEEGH